MIVDKKTKVKRILTIILALILIGCIATLAWHWGEGQRADEVQEELSGQAVKKTVKTDGKTNPIDFETLKAENPDIYAWIAIDDTDISYPILQNQDTTDLYDEYYLDHLVDGTSGFAGALFTQPVNAMDFSDGNTVIYGHNLKNGTMFTHLHDYEDQSFLNAHKKIYVYTPDAVKTYEVFAAVPFSDQHLMIAYNFAKESGVEQFIEDVYAAGGVYAEDVSVSGQDRLLTLSTCMNSAPKERYLVVAKEVED